MQHNSSRSPVGCARLGVNDDRFLAVRDMLRDYGLQIRATIDHMTGQTLASWQDFRGEAARATLDSSFAE